MKNLKLPLLWLTLFGILNSGCGTVNHVTDAGPVATVCVTDVAGGGYYCSHDGVFSFVSFKDAPPMLCTSPKDQETKLKACRRGIIQVVPSCTVVQGVPECSPVALPLEQMDNYLCLSPEDNKRVMERCSLGL